MKILLKRMLLQIILKEVRLRIKTVFMKEATLKMRTMAKAMGMLQMVSPELKQEFLKHSLSNLTTEE